MFNCITRALGALSLAALALLSSAPPTSAAALARPVIEAILDKNNPAFAAMHRYFPDRYAKLIDSIKDEDMTDVVAFNQKAFPVIGQIVVEHLGEIDDANAKETFALLIEEARLLKDVSPESCIALLNGQTPAINIAKVMPPELAKRDLANTAAILEQVAKRPAQPASPMTDDAAAKYALAALQQMPEAEQTQALPLLTERKPETPAEMKVVCNYTLLFISAVLKGAPDGARSMMAGH